MNFGLQTALISCWLFPMSFTILVMFVGVCSGILVVNHNRITKILILGIFKAELQPQSDEQ